MNGGGAMKRFPDRCKRSLRGWFIVLTVILTGCGSGADISDNGSNVGMTRVTTSVQGPAELNKGNREFSESNTKPVPSDTKSARIEVEREGVTLAAECRNLQGGEASINFNFDVLSGSNSNFLGQGFSEDDCQGNPLYQGRTLGVELLPGIPVTVQIHLSFLGSIPPVVNTSAATGITNTCVQLNGAVNPNGFHTVAWFEFGIDHSYSTSTLSARKEHTGVGDQSVQTQICGLAPATVYHARIVASNGADWVFGNDQDFTTLDHGGTDTTGQILFPDDLPPAATTSAPTNISATGVIFNGLSNPNGTDTQVYFEWGTDINYGRTTPLQGIGNGFEEVAINAKISTLTPGTTYHFRIVAFNVFGIRVGQDQMFHAPTTIFSEDFENGIGKISVSNGIFEIGTPTFGPGNAFQGENVAGTGLRGNYPDNTSSRLMFIPFRLPALGIDEEIHLSFFQWFAFGGGSTALGSRSDWGQVQVREELSPGTFGDWVTLSISSGGSPQWTRGMVDLSRYAGKVIQLGFLLDQGFGGVGPGWFIDEIVVRPVKIRVIGKEDTLIEDFENGLDQGSGDNGVWQEGIPTSGPNSAHSGSNVAATVLGGVYPDNISSRWVSPSYRFPSLNTGEIIRLRIWHWFSFGGASSALGSRGDFGQVQVRTEISPGSWSAWSTVQVFSGSSGNWTTALIDLPNNLSAKKVQFGFLLDQGFGGVSTGWYLDDLSTSVGLAP